MIVTGHRCLVPNISVSEPRTNFGQQFRTLPFNACIKLMNSSEIPTAYKILPQSEQNEDDLSCLLYSATEPEVCIKEFGIVLSWFHFPVVSLQFHNCSSPSCY